MSPSPRQIFLETFDRECATTLKVLRAYPEDKAELRPHPRGKSARELAFIFAVVQGLTMGVLTDSLGKSPPPPAPDTIAGSIAAFEDGKAKLVEMIKALSEEQVTSGTVKFFVAPKTMGDIPTMDFLWFILFDQIHHRGQFSIYLRMANAKVPSIYGATADEPWM